MVIERLKVDSTLLVVETLVEVVEYISVTPAVVLFVLMVLKAVFVAIGETTERLWLLS